MKNTTINKIGNIVILIGFIIMLLASGYTGDSFSKLVGIGLIGVGTLVIGFILVQVSKEIDKR